MVTPRTRRFSRQECVLAITLLLVAAAGHASEKPESLTRKFAGTLPDLGRTANPVAWFTPWGGIAVAATGGLMAVDQPLAREARRADHDAGWAKGLRTTADLASAPIPLAFGVIGWAAGAGSHNNRLKAAGQAAILSVAAAAGTVHILKFAVGRIRPNSSSAPGDPPDAFRFEPFTSFGNALPSGHTAGAAALAGVLSKAYPGWPTWAAAALTVAAGTARIVDGNHWISDVALGGAIGFHMGRRAAAGRMDALSVRF